MKLLNFTQIGIVTAESASTAFIWIHASRIMGNILIDIAKDALEEGK